MERRRFIHHTTMSLFSTAFFPVIFREKGSLGDFPLHECSIHTMQENMQKGVWSAEYLAKQYLQRIQELDRKGPALHAVIEINPDALSIAREMDKARKAGKWRGPLHGIPVLIKDNIDTADKMMTTAGALALEGNYAAKDAFIVARLREAGAVLLGKTNLSEWANFRSTRSASGWSSRGGQTKNPYLLERSPCGSSSGSGVAVAADLCAVAIGTETNGSISCPSSINGIVGIKPTVGLWSRSGIIPISHTQDTAGPMARSVEDAAILLGALTGVDNGDSATAGSRDHVLPDYTVCLKENGLVGKRIGVEKSFLKGHEGVTACLQEAMQTLQYKGATVIEVELEARLKDLGDAEFNVLCFEFKAGVDKYLAQANAKVKNLQDVIDFNRANESKAMPWFKQEILELSQAKGDLESTEYQEALKKTLLGSRQAIDQLLQEQQLDAIIGPANGPSWCIDLVNGDAFTGYGAYSAAAMAGYPSITVPMGEVHGLPVGLAFTGTAYNEAGLLSLAYAYEQASKKRKAPQFRH